MGSFCVASITKMFRLCALSKHAGASTVNATIRGLTYGKKVLSLCVCECMWTCVCGHVRCHLLRDKGTLVA
jgi:hypothetical protein